MSEQTLMQIAILAKAPIAGWAKTRLIPALGAAGAARLQRQFTRQAVHTAQTAALGPVTLWCAPQVGHRFFRALQRTSDLRCRAQPDGDLGERMHSAFRLHCADSPLLLIGTDCPALRPEHLHRAAEALGGGADAVFIPAEDGGYCLVGLRQPQPALFLAMSWSHDGVMSETRRRAAALGLTLCELAPLWDVDLPADLARLAALNAVAVGADAGAGAGAGVEAAQTAARPSAA
jgi:rSAM/selenodomain-associated transferase 1